jgi:transcriptional regulator with XRE-family HTH domain
VRGSIGEEVGHALRRARLARGLTLRQVGERSGGAFKPTAVAGYERAERTISLERFCQLCGFYGVAPAWLLAGILETIDGGPDVLVDLTQPDDSTAAALPRRPIRPG